MVTLQQIAKWNSFANPLERVCGGGGSICPTLVARGQGDHAQMILYSPQLEDTTNLRWMFEDEREHNLSQGI